MLIRLLESIIIFSSVWLITIFINKIAGEKIINTTGQFMISLIITTVVLLAVNPAY